MNIRHLPSVQRNVGWSFLLALVTALGITVVSVALQVQANRAAARLERGHEVLDALGGLLQGEVDAETGQRGFLITGDARYLSPYSAGSAEIRRRFTQLQGLLTPTPANRLLLSQLQTLVDAKRAELAQTIELRKAHGFAAARAVVQTDLGRRTLDRIRSLVQQRRQAYRAGIHEEHRQVLLRAERAEAALLVSAFSLTLLLLWSYRRIRSDLNVQRTLAERLTHEAGHDALTGLPNRRFLGARLEHALKESLRNGREVALLLLDLDGFKAVNDRFGHERGDQLLQAVARRLQATVRPADVVARLGGDEFAVLLANLTHPENAAGFAGRIQEAFRSPFPEAVGAPLGLSIGLAIYPLDAPSGQGLLVAADTAMYRAKAAGGDRYLRFQKETLPTPDKG